MYCERRGNGQNHPDKTFQTKDPLTKPSDKNPCEQLRENLYRGFCPGFLYYRPTKNWKGPRCVTYFWGEGPGMCDNVWQREGQNWPKIAWRTLWTAPYKKTRQNDRLSCRPTILCVGLLFLDYVNSVVAGRPKATMIGPICRALYGPIYSSC